MKAIEARTIDDIELKFALHGKKFKRPSTEISSNEPELTEEEKKIIQDGIKRRQAKPSED